MEDEKSVFYIINNFLFRSRKQRVLFILILVTIAATAILSALFPVLFSLAIDSFYKEGLQSAIAVKYIIAFGISMTIVGVLEQIQWMTFGPMNLRLQRHITLYIFNKALSIPYYKLKKYTTYEIGRTVEKGLNAVQEIVTNLTFSLIPVFTELIIAASVIAFVINVWIALFLFSALVLYGVIANISARKIRHATEKAMETGIDAWNFGLDGVANAELIQQANKTDYFTRCLDEKVKINNRDWAVTFRLRSWFGVLQALLFGCVVTGVLWSGAVGVSEEVLTIGHLVLLNTYIIRLMQPVETFAEVYREVHAFAGEAKLLMNIISIPVPGSKSQPVRSYDKPVSLVLDKVTLCIDDEKIIRDLSFTVPAGGQLFIVGPSGVGKTSLLRLLSGLNICESGDYFFAGEKVTEDNVTAFRESISVVQQDCLLFDWTVVENIAFGLDASAEQVEEVILRLGLQDVVQRHQQSGELTVGERGNRLSGGEKQRLSLARSLLAKPKLLLLDEPTSALDEINRRKVLDAITELQGSCTMIFVTHDFSLLKADSHVLFLASASHYVTGVHADLLADNFEYRNFARAEDSKSNFES